MKTFLVFLFVFALGLASVQGQAANQVFSNDTTKGAQTKYFTGTKEASIYQGIAGFVFTTAHDNATFYLEGCYTTNNWQPIDTLAVTGSTLVSRKMTQSPPVYKNYRLRVLGSAGDTCYISNVRYILKY
jgi:hypothetical protein